MEFFKSIDYQVTNLHLGSIPAEIKCPSCFLSGETKVRYEASTFIQRFSSMLELCLRPCKWHASKDINHYCNSCGCFIGRDIKIGVLTRIHLAKQMRKALDHGCTEFEKDLTNLAKAFEKLGTFHDRSSTPDNDEHSATASADEKARIADDDEGNSVSEHENPLIHSAKSQNADGGLKSSTTSDDIQISEVAANGVAALNADDKFPMTDVDRKTVHTKISSKTEEVISTNV